MDNKKRRYFYLEDTHENILAKGVMYTEYNVQILWREDIGWTGEQYSNIALVLNLMPGVCLLRMVPFL